MRIVMPVRTGDDRQCLDLVTDLVRGHDPALASEIKDWAALYRDRFYPDHELRYDWEVNA